MKEKLEKFDVISYMLFAILGVICAGAVGSLTPMLHGNFIWLPLGIWIILVVIIALQLRNKRLDDVTLGDALNYSVAYVLSVLALASLMVFIKSGVFFLIREVF